MIWLLWACQADTSLDTHAPLEEQARLELATIQGTLNRTVPCEDDCVGMLMIVLFREADVRVEQYPYRGWSQFVMDFSGDDTIVEFELANIFPQEEPYYVGAILDEDFSFFESVESIDTPGDLVSGDMVSWEPVLLGSGEVLELSISLEGVIPES